MFEPTLLFGTIFAIASAGIYFYVGWRLSRRRVILPDARLAWTLFVVWWYAFAGATLSEGVLKLLGLLGITSLPLMLTILQTEYLAICIGLYGLIYYLLYLFTGNRRILTPLMIFYVAYYFLLLYFVNLGMPTGVTIGRWSISLTYQQQQPVLFALLIVFLLLFPQIICGIAYFTLYFRLKDASQKYRVALVSWSIIILFLASLLTVFGLSKFDWWQIINWLIGLGAALMILMAYHPVTWIKNHLGVSAIAEEND